MTQEKNTTDQDNSNKLPGAEEVARELGKAKSIEVFFAHPFKKVQSRSS